MKKGYFAAVLAFILGWHSDAISQELLWARQLGGPEADVGYATVEDPDGNLITAGNFGNTADFDPGTGTFEMTSAGIGDIFITKLTNGGDFVWAKQVGDVHNDGAYALTTDVEGNVYVTGYFMGIVDFDPGANEHFLTSINSTNDIYVLKLDSDGNFLWVSQLGGIDAEYGTSIAVDTSGNVLTTGRFYATADFDPGNGVFEMTPASFAYFDVFVSKLDSDGNFIWARQLGGTSDDRGFSLALNADGDVYVAGWFYGTADFDPGVGVSEFISFGGSDIFIVKLNIDGDLVWADQLGGIGEDAVYSIALDPAGNVLATGYLMEEADFDPGSGIFTLVPSTSGDVFVSKYSDAGELVWAKSCGGIGADYGLSVASDNDGNVWTSGFFNLTVDFDPGSNTSNLTTSGATDVFALKLDPSGEFIWAGHLGGLGDDSSSSIAVADDGDVIVTGTFSGTAEFDPGIETTEMTSAGSYDTFIAKLGEGGDGVESVDAADGLSMYPNPVDPSRTLYLSSNFGEISSVEIQDLTGRTIRYAAGDLVPNGRGSYAWNVAGVNPGIYLLQVNSGDVTKAFRLVVE